MKRLFDFAVSLAGCAALLPAMAVIAALIKLTSDGPVLYAQKRTGLGGAPFLVYKFRTMVPRADALGSSVTTGVDPRVTPFGRFLRRTKLDELPQLWNVLKGDMSFVGPRPDVPEITDKYTADMRRVFSVRPGITSVATLHFRGEEDILSRVKDPDRFYEEFLVPFKVELAMEHVRRASFLFDLEILVQTVWMLTPLRALCPVRELDAVRRFKEKHSL